jgi:hypothetical protein
MSSNLALPSPYIWNVPELVLIFEDIARVEILVKEIFQLLLFDQKLGLRLLIKFLIHTVEHHSKIGNTFSFPGWDPFLWSYLSAESAHMNYLPFFKVKRSNLLVPPVGMVPY